MSDFFLGIDGGGTTSRAAIANQSGEIIGRGTSGSANIVSDPDAARKHILDASLMALSAAGISKTCLSTIPAVIGAAGATIRHSADALRLSLPFHHALVLSDGEIALEGAFGSQDGSVAILGTGTYFLCRVQGHVSTVGGWGFLIGDGGSGASIGRAALQETILALEGIRTATPLCTAIASRFDDSPADMVDFAQGATPADFASHAHEVFAAATAGDAAAVRIIRQAAHQVDEALDRLTVLGGKLPLCLLGGLSSLYPPFLAARHRMRLETPKGDAVDGALHLAKVRFCQRAGEAA